MQAYSQTSRRVALAVLLSFAAVAGFASTASADAPEPLKITFGEDDNTYIRLITWHQMWMRAMEMNPGSQVQGNDVDWTSDFGLRRSRFLLLGQYDRTQVVFHFGINNQTFNNARKPQLFVHDAWAAYDVVPGNLTLGAGLHYYNGISRLNNASTLNFMTLDAPIVNWATIERTDQFARMMGIFAKGHFGNFDYRIALNRPFSTTVTPAPGGPADYNPEANTWASAGYLQYFFGEQESNLLPYAVGTYLGAKSVFTLGAGWLYHPEGMATADAAGEFTQHDIFAFGVDLFVDQPLGGGSAFTGYLGYYHYDFGPNHLRNVGIMNVATGGDTFNGAGNAYPVLGTGEHIVVQAGYLLPGRPMGLQVQPYIAGQISLMEALDDPMIAPEGGVNWLIHGHHLKLTTHYRSRPIFEVDGEEVVTESRASELIAQFMVFF